MAKNSHVKLAKDIVKYSQNIEELATNSLIALYKIRPTHYVCDQDFVKGYKKLHNIIEEVEGRA